MNRLLRYFKPKRQDLPRSSTVAEIARVVPISCQKLESLDYIIVHNKQYTVGIASVTLMYVAPKAATLCEITTITPLSGSRSLKVTDFSTDRKHHSIVAHNIFRDIINRLGVDDQCDRRTELR